MNSSTRFYQLLVNLDIEYHYQSFINNSGSFRLFAIYYEYINIKKMENNNENPKDKAARMNKFFEEMSQKINAEEEQEQFSKNTASSEHNSDPNDNQGTSPEEEFASSDSSNEKKQGFFEALQELKKELDPKADELIDKSINKSKEIFKKAEQEGKVLFDKFDKYTDELEVKLKAREAEFERKSKERQEQYKPSDSLFDRAGGLFEKAKKFVDNEKQKHQEKKDSINIIKTETKKPKTDDKIYGFEDLDGDGNPLIDDAIIED